MALWEILGTRLSLKCRWNDYVCLCCDILNMKCATGAGYSKHRIIYEQQRVSYKYVINLIIIVYNL